jgi:hypothetical protein
VLRFTFILGLMFTGSCKKSDSKLDLSIGLDTLGRMQGAEGAPTFKVFAEWVEKFSVSSSKNPQNKNEHHLSLESYLKSFPSVEERQRMIDVIDYELKTLEVFGSEDNLLGFAQNESRDIFEVIAVLLYPKQIEGGLQSPFAKFMRDFSQDTEENFLDEFAQDFLSTLSAQVGSFPRLAEQLDIEKDAFVNLLASFYQDQGQDKGAIIGRLITPLLRLKSQLEKTGNTIEDHDINLNGITAAFMYFQSMAYRAEKKEDESEPGTTSGTPSPHAPEGSFLRSSQSLTLQQASKSMGCPSELEIQSCPDGEKVCLPRGYRCAKGRALSRSTWSKRGETGQTLPVSIRLGQNKQSFYCQDLNSLTPAGRVFYEKLGSFTQARAEHVTGFGFDNFSGLNASDWREAASAFKGQTMTVLLSDHATPVQN